MGPDRRLQKPERRKAAGEDAHESALLRRVVAQDREALTELYSRYHARLFKFVYRLTHSYSASDELVNDIMLIVWQNAASFRGDSSVATWMFGIAYRQAMRRLSRKRLRVVAAARSEEPVTDDRADVELKDWLQQGLDALPPAQQLTVMLVFYLGLSYPEVAEVTACPVNTVKTRMYHARLKLREFLTRSGVCAVAGEEGP
ncbi:MAG TPA: sigma-70 family RNA polymerase sigma factor [Woeseiaceae bacterium]|nr:sigma-70 family RNA polymerase sigma factor [Woeseiaceae bacterium]